MDYTERKLQTLRFLNLLYVSVIGIANESHYVISTKFAQNLNLDYATTMELAHYLEGKKLIKIGIKASGADYRLIFLTEQGVNEVEAARENKEKTPIEKYPPGTINQIYNYGQMIGSPIVQGSSDISNIQSNVNYEINDIQKIKVFINELKKEYQNYALDSVKKSQVEADLSSINSQMQSPNPKVKIIKEIARNVLDIVQPFASEAVKQAGMSLLGQN